MFGELQPANSMGGPGKFRGALWNKRLNSSLNAPEKPSTLLRSRVPESRRTNYVSSDETPRLH